MRRREHRKTLKKGDKQFGKLGGTEQKNWWPLIKDLGPDWAPIGWVAGTMRDALTRRGLVEFHNAFDFRFARLTPAGMALRDMWIEHRATAEARREAQAQRERAAGPRDA